MKITVADRLSGTEEYYFSRKLREIEQLNKQGKNIINLGIGSPDLPPAPEVIDTLGMEAANPRHHGYQSYKGSPQLRQAIAAWYQRYYGVEVDPDREVLPLIGSKEGIVHICMTYLQAGDEALIPNPGYPTYASAVRLSGARGLSYKLGAARGWLPDLDQLARQDLSSTKLMWINYPHMPTGATATESFFEELVAFAREHSILLCHDNPYSFILTEKPCSLLSVPGAMDVAIELNSLSKALNMAGWRIGMMLGHEDRIQEVLRFKSNMDSGMFLPLQLAAVQALRLEQDWYEQLNGIYQERKQLAFQLMDRLDCRYETNQSGLFVWAKIPQGYASGYELSDAVLDRAGVFITPGGIFGNAGDTYIRVSLCANADTFGEAIARLDASGHY